MQLMNKMLERLWETWAGRESPGNGSSNSPGCPWPVMKQKAAPAIIKSPAIYTALLWIMRKGT